MKSAAVDERFFALMAEFLSSLNGSRVEIYDVETREPLTMVATATEQDAQEVLATVKTAQVVWESMGGHGRAKVLARLAQLLWKFQDEIIATSQILSGKSLMDATEEFLDLLSAVQIARKLSGSPIRHSRGRGFLPFSSYRIRHIPVGVVGMYTSPDWPLSSLSDVLQALVAGNGVVNFVTPQASLGAVLMHTLMADAGMPYGLWKIIPSKNSKVGLSIIPGLDMVSVLGSDKLGRRVSSVCQEVGVPFCGFLGMTNLGVVCADARFDHAVRGIARASFHNAGQSVTSVESVFVDRRIWDDFVVELKEFTQSQVTVGSLSDSDTTLGSMLNPTRVERVKSLVDDAVERGATLVTGGHKREDLGKSFFEPTILIDVPSDASISQEEIHGPVVRLIPFDDLAEVVHYISSIRQAHISYLFTRSGGVMEDFMELAETSAVGINDSYMSLYSAWSAPLQGLKDTGYGIRHGRESILQYTHFQLSMRQRLVSWIPDSLHQGNWLQRAIGIRNRLALLRASMFTDNSVVYAFGNFRLWLFNCIRGPV